MNNYQIGDRVKIKKKKLVGVILFATTIYTVQVEDIDTLKKYRLRYCSQDELDYIK